MGASAMLGMMEEERKYMVEMGFCDCGHYNALHVRRSDNWGLTRIVCPIRDCKCDPNPKLPKAANISE